MLRVSCDKCGRDGCYGLGRLIEKRGRDAKLIDWVDELTAECPKKIAHNMNDPCGAKCPQLPKVMSARPDAGPKERARRRGLEPGPALTTAYLRGTEGHAVLKTTFAELLRSCSCNISPACCGICVTHAVGPGMGPRSNSTS